jgi:phosphopantetheinyl transferase
MDHVLLSVLPIPGTDAKWIRKQAEPILPPGARIPAGRSESRKAEFFAGRAALAIALARLKIKGVVEPDPELGYLSLRPRQGLFVNISHTTGIAVAVVAGHPVGVDVEAVARDTSRVMQRVSSPAELAAIRGRRFSQVPGGVALWSAKEAVSKATGLGIKFGMQHFVVSLAEPSPHPVAIGVRGPLTLHQPAVVLHRHADFVVAVCSELGALTRPLEVITVAPP